MSESEALRLVRAAGLEISGPWHLESGWVETLAG
jgi:hypothetical protein